MCKANVFKALAYTLLHILLLNVSTYAQERDRELDRLVAFARLAGDIQYFSPTDMVDSMTFHSGWENIIWNGVRMSRSTTNEKDFVDSLVQYFRPIEPSLQLTYAGNKRIGAPPREEKELIVSRQHRGLQLYSGNTSSFKSIRTNRRSLVSDEDLSFFDFIRIKVPQGEVGKPFEIKLTYRSEQDRLIKKYLANKFVSDISLTASDSTYIYRDTIVKDSGFLVVKIGYPDHIDTFSLSHDGSITIDGKKYPIKDLTVEEVPNSIKALEWRIIENDEKLFEETNLIGDTLRLQLTDRISAEFPLAVYATNEHTYPLTTVSTKAYPYNKGLPPRVYFDADVQQDINLRLANIILIWNVFRISFVYNPFDEESEIAFLRRTLNEVLNGKDADDYDFTLRKMLYAYKDAHIFYHNKLQDGKYEFSAPITLIHLKDGFYIKSLHDDSLKSKLNAGDKLTAIDGEPIEER